MTEHKRVGRFDPSVIRSTIASMGGKAATAILTHEERVRRGKKSARTLGAAGRRERALKGQATRRQRAEEAKRGQGLAALRDEQRGKFMTMVDKCGPLPTSMLASAEPVKRPLPKAGTRNWLVLETVKDYALWHQNQYPVETAALILSLQRSCEASEVRNSLSSLRTAGHVISEPHPTSKRERLWRLA